MNTSRRLSVRWLPSRCERCADPAHARSSRTVACDPARNPPRAARNDLAAHVVRQSHLLSHSSLTSVFLSASKDPDLETTYSTLLKQTSSHEKSIGRDLSRTFPKHEYFRDADGPGQENL